MSSLFTVHGTLTFPHDRVQVWRDTWLPIDEDDRDDCGTFGAASDLDSVRLVLDDTDDCWPFVRFILDGDVLRIRAALGDDHWYSWCGRIRAVVTAAAQCGASGYLECEDDGCYAGVLEIRGPEVVFVPPSRERRDITDRDGEAAVYAILQEILDAEQARRRASATTRAAKKSAKRPASKKTAGKKSAGKKAASKQTKRG